MAINNSISTKTHGKLLTAIFILALVTLVGSMPDRFNSTELNSIFGPKHDLLALYWIINIVINLIALVGIWTWHKWGIFLLFAAYIIQMVLSLLTFSTVGTVGVIGGLIAFAIVFGLWYWALSSKWQLFN